MALRVPFMALRVCVQGAPHYYACVRGASMISGQIEVGCIGDNHDVWGPLKQSRGS